MEGIENKRVVYEFGSFTLDPEGKVLLADEKSVHLPAKEFQTLLMLVENNGRALSKEEMMSALWEEDFVEEVNLAKQISQLRKILHANGETFIETVPKHGYRFSADVRFLVKGQQAALEMKRVKRMTVAFEGGSESAAEASDEARHKPQLETQIAEKRVPKTLFRRPVTLISILAFLSILGAAAYWQVRSVSKSDKVTSIAVLPLKSYANNDENEELRLKITDALITKLGNLDQISVRPTTSVLRFAKEDIDAIQAGRAMSVDTVLDGRVQTEGERLRVTLQLVSVENGEQLWSEQFDGRVGEILALQDKVSERIRQKLTLAETKNFERRLTESNEAYEAYLKGRYFWNQRAGDSYLKAIDSFKTALQIDPNFALAYSGLADSYILINLSEEMLAKAEEAALKALELDDTSAEVHASVGLVRIVYKRDWEVADRHFQKSIELNPQYSVAYAWYGLSLTSQGKFEDAEAQLKKAESIDPTSLHIATYRVLNLYFARQYDRAIEQGRKALELRPRFGGVLLFISKSFEQKRMYDQAVEAFLERESSPSPESVELRQAFAQEGIEGFWRKQLEQFSKNAKKGPSCRIESATRSALLGRKDEAIKLIEENFRTGGNCWNFLLSEPAFDTLRDEPRFKDVLHEINL